MILLSFPLEIVRAILAFTTAPTLCRLAGTCHAVDDLVIEELNFRYDSILTFYVADRPAFRSLLGSTSSAIAGSSAVLICGLPDTFVPGDLDVYCDDYGLPVLRDHLVTTERFVVVSERHRATCHPSLEASREAERLIPLTHVDRAYRESLRNASDDAHPMETSVGQATDAEYASGISRIVHLRRDDVYIDLISSTSPCPMLPIVNFWSTAPMCFLTENGVHILYPRLQEYRRALLTPCRLPPVEPDEPAPNVIDIVAKHKAHSRDLIAKYVDRGFDIQHTEHAWDAGVSTRGCGRSQAAACPFTIRWVGDSSCMDLSLVGNVNARMLSPAEKLGLGFFTAVWTRGGTPCGPFCSDKDSPAKASAYTTCLEYLH